MEIMVYIADGWQVPIHKLQFLVYSGPKLVAVLPAEVVLDAVKFQLAQASLTSKFQLARKQLSP